MSKSKIVTGLKQAVRYSRGAPIDSLPVNVAEALLAIERNAACAIANPWQVRAMLIAINIDVARVLTAMADRK